MNETDGRAWARAVDALCALWQTGRLTLRPGAAMFTPLTGELETDEERALLAAYDTAGGKACNVMTGRGGGREVQLSAALINAADEERRRRWHAAHATDAVEVLGIDIETYSAAPIAEVGAYRYAEDGTTRLLLFGYSVNGGPATTVDIDNGEVLPERIREALTDARVLKTAYNATFERAVLSRWLGLAPGHYLDPAAWDCTMARALRLGLPAPLADCARALRLPEEKMPEGRALIRLFCTPARVTKARPGGGRFRRDDRPEEWETFKRYNVRDVDVEQAVRERVAFEPTPWERAVQVTDAKINDRGIRIDTRLARKAMEAWELEKQTLRTEARELTGLENPGSVAQLKKWIQERTHRTAQSLAKKSVDELRGLDKDVDRMLAIRARAGKTSPEKYAVMLAAASPADGRLRGMLQYLGAARTGRWSGRVVQLQNLPQNKIEGAALEEARAALKEGAPDELMALYGAGSAEVLAGLIRTAFVPTEGCKFIVCDYSAIEARVLAWLAGEEWVLDVFRTTGKIYETTAARMFHCDASEITKHDPRRAKGKVAVLALGYGGGTGALEAMGGARLGLKPSEMQDLVAAWRAANPDITKMWRRVEAGARRALEARGRWPVAKAGVAVEMWRGGLRIWLPSGRFLYYPRFGTDGENRLIYEGTNQTTKRWEVVDTWGGKLTENIVQAVARDLLADTLLRLENSGLEVVAHVHDEVIIDAAPGRGLEEVKRIFAETPAWAKGLPLSGDGFEAAFYQK